MTDINIQIEPTKGFSAKSASPEIYQRAEAFLIGKFGKDSIAYKEIMFGISPENATGSNIFFNIAVQQTLPQNQRVVTLDDLVKMYAHNQDVLKGRFADTTEIIFYSNTPSIEKNTKIVEYLSQLVKDQNYGSENPLRITNLGIEPDDNSQNPYGVKFITTKKTNSFNDSRFAYSGGGKTENFNGTNISVRTKKDGVSGLYLYGSGLYSWDDDLAFSDVNDRVVVVDAEGVAAEK